MGDPAGCGPQITSEAWQTYREAQRHPFYVIGEPNLYRSVVPVVEIAVPDDALAVFETALPILPVTLESARSLTPGVPSSAYAPAIIDSIKSATLACLNGEAAAVVTNPIAKHVLYDAGFAFPGHTEFIASLCAEAHDTTIRPVMMLVGGGLKVALSTIHVPLLRVLEHLTTDSLFEVASITDSALRRDFGVSEPRIAFTGLNPHAGESGSIGTEERDIINPVADRLRQKGINITDARSADTVFHEALNGAFDAVIAMTHDQGLIPVKTLDMWGGVNTTLGLPIIRTSPDHGTAYDAAADGTCRPDSLLAALSLAEAMCRHRDQANV